jgi:amidohydrolase
MSTLHDVKREVSKIEKEIIALRRYFHKYPELCLEEYKTSAKVQSVLKKAGIPFDVKAKTGVVGYINRDADITIGLRADMDALPVEEKTGLPFTSATKGIMHACGHDGHTAVLLGTAKVLKRLEKHLRVNLKFIFQPCEEKPPGGASLMIKEGVLDNVDNLIGFHVFPFLPLYKIWIGKGPVMANTDFFRITVKGKGGHGSSPETTNDPVVCSAAIITGLQTVVSRRLSPSKPAVISVCKISGGDAFNIIPEEVELTGTVRTLDDETREKIKTEMKKKVEMLSAGFGCSAELEYDTYSPLCINDVKFSEGLERLAKSIFSDKNIVDFHPIMGGEDFAFFSQKVPSAYIFLGIGDKYGANHNNNFSIDERVLPYMINFLSSLILNMPFSSLP